MYAIQGEVDTALSRELLQKSLAKLRGTTPQPPEAFHLQEIGLLRAFLDQRTQTGSVSANEAKLHERVQALLKVWRPPTPATGDGQERRTQLVLRHAIDEALAGRWNELSEDDRQLLHATFRTLKADAPYDEGSRLARLMELLERAIAAGANEAPARRHAASKSTGGTTQPTSTNSPNEITNHADADERVTNSVVAADHFGDIQHMRLSFLEEIEVDLNVRIYKFKGNTEIDGDIPSDVLVQVEDGFLRVGGDILGAASASGPLTIGGNLKGGVAISLFGDVAVQDVHLNSFLVSRGGTVNCGRVEAPELIFGWQGVNVSGTAVDGRIIGRHVRFADRVMSAKVHSCGAVEAERFETGARGPVVVCLRDRLRCQDYDRPPKGDADQALRDLKESEDFVQRATQLNVFNAGMVHSCYRTALFYLLGGVENAAAAVEFAGLNVMAMHMRRILAVADSTANLYQRFIDEPEEEAPDSARIQELDRILSLTKEPLRAIRNDAEGFPQQFGVVHRRYLLDRCEEFRRHIKLLGDDFQRSDDATYLTQTYLPAMKGWDERLKESERKAAGILRNSGLTEEIMARIQGDPDSLDQLLLQSLEEQRKSESQSERSRAESPLIRLLQDQADRFRRAMELSQRGMQNAIKKANTLRMQLDEDAILHYGERRRGANYAVAEFIDAGTVFTADASSTEGADVPIGKTIVLSEPLKSGEQFVREGDMIIREARSD